MEEEGHDFCEALAAIRAGAAERRLQLGGARAAAAAAAAAADLAWLLPLRCLYTSEDKAEYGVSEAVPDEDWIPIKRDLPAGRLVVSHGLIPVNATAAEAGFDFVESYYDPKRDYSWSYKRYNPYKLPGDGSEEPEEEGVAPYYRLDTPEARRYYLKEAEPPPREPDDDIARQATLAEEMIAVAPVAAVAAAAAAAAVAAAAANRMRAPAPLCLLPGMRRSPEREEQWRFIPEAPYGILASRQNFARSFTAKDKAWIEK
ncbi:hypothetical protein ETH_00026350, partial [Eimeria tenella]